MTPLRRLIRMRRTFATSRSIALEDYEHFTRLRAPIPPNKAGRKSAGQSEPQSPELSEKQSSDRNDD